MFCNWSINFKKKLSLGSHIIEEGRGEWNQLPWPTLSFPGTKKMFCNRPISFKKIVIIPGKLCYAKGEGRSESNYPDLL